MPRTAPPRLGNSTPVEIPEQQSAAVSRTLPVATSPVVETPVTTSSATCRQAPAGPAGDGVLSAVRAWMVVLPMDALMLLLPATWAPQHWKAFASLALIVLLLFTAGGRYRARLQLGVLDELPSIMAKLLIAVAVVATVTALRHETGVLESFLAAAVVAMGLVVLGRIVTTQLILLGRRRRIVAHHALLVGGGAVSTTIATILQDDPRFGLRVIGHVDNDPPGLARSAAPYLGRLEDMDRIVREEKVRVILVADGRFAETDLLDLVRTPACYRCDLLVVPRLHEFHTQAGLVDNIGAIPVMRIRTPALRGLSRVLKRAFDIVLSSVMLVLASPVMALCAVAVRLDGPGILFRQERVGRDGEYFHCLKFRSMRPRNRAESDTTWSVANDDRIGAVGRFLRRTSLDELPQLFNILRGDMTLVGPRPERPHFVDRFAAQYPRYAHRHRVSSGLTGLAQVSGLRGDTSIAARARHDNYYIENWSLWLDVKILLRTIAEVLFARGR